MNNMNTAELKPEELKKANGGCIFFHSWRRTGQKKQERDDTYLDGVCISLGYYTLFEEKCADCGDTRWVKDGR